MGGLTSCLWYFDSTDAEKKRRWFSKLKKDSGSQITPFLLVGAGESGKSTIVKQTQLITGVKFSQNQLEMFRDIIHSNIVEYVHKLLQCMLANDIALGVPENSKHAKILCQANVPNFEFRNILSNDVAMAITALWNDPGIKQAAVLSKCFYQTDSLVYYLDSLFRIMAASYIPTEQDIIRARIKSTGVQEIFFKYKMANFKMIDVGGQRSERRKWVSCFHNIEAVIFMAALSEYDQTLAEDPCSNRMKESFRLFEWLCNQPAFRNTSIVLFLNKIDLFKEKLRKSLVADYFPEYQGPNSYEDAGVYFMNKFLDIAKHFNRDIYVQFTCATDTQQIKVVLDAVYSSIVRKSLRKNGLL